jgi:hypothetical protein
MYICRNSACIYVYLYMYISFTGMEVCFIVKFKPQEVREYHLDLVCSTEREKFIVPVRAVGHRPEILLPDEILFGVCAVKSANKRTLLVRNVGPNEAKFTVQSMHGAFICPNETIAMNPGASQSLEIFFTPNYAVLIESELIVEFSQGGKVYIAIKGTGENSDVSLSTPSLAMEPSFISLLSQRSLRIKNMGSQSIRYIHAYTYPYKYAFVYMIFINMYIYTYNVYEHVNTGMHKYISICMHSCRYTYTYLSMLYVFVCIYVHLSMLYIFVCI